MGASQSAFDWLDLASRRGRSRPTNVIASHDATRTPLSRSTPARLVKVMGPRIPLLAACRRGAWSRRPARRRCFSPNLCSRLVVTSTRWNASLPSSGLSPVRPPRPPSRFPSSLRPSFHAPSSTATADGRCRPLRTLGGSTVGAAPPAAASITAPRGGSVSRAHGPSGRFRPFPCPAS